MAALSDIHDAAAAHVEREQAVSAREENTPFEPLLIVRASASAPRILIPQNFFNLIRLEPLFSPSPSSTLEAVERKDRWCIHTYTHNFDGAQKGGWHLLPVCACASRTAKSQKSKPA